MIQGEATGDEWSFLQEGGEMGALIRSTDWSATSLGGPDSWPQSLRTTLSIVINSAFPMFLFWGGELISFYNDKFRPSLGNEGKHPSALGKPGSKVWPEIWEFIKPWIDSVLQTSRPVYMEDQLVPFYRNGQIENIYWTFSYSPVNDESGQPAGVFVTCFETSEKLRNFDQLQQGKDELEFAIDAADLATWDYNPLTDKFTSNGRLKSWFGLTPSDQIELPAAIEAIIEEDRGRVAAAIQRALQHESGGFYDIVYTIINKKTAEQRIVRAKGRAWFTEEGKAAYRFNGTLQDITEQETARLKLVQAEEKAWLAVGTANLGTYEIDLETGEITSSGQFNNIWGSAPSPAGKKVISHVHPEDQEIRIKAHQDSILTGELDYQVRVSWPDQSQHWVRLHGKVLYDSHGKAITLLGVIQDITEQKQFAELLAEQVKERTLELQRSNDDLLQFAHVITHDLKEPVRKIKIYSNRIKDELEDTLPALADSYLTRIQNATRRMTDMIEGVLNYSSLSSSDEKNESVDLNAIIQDIQADLEILIQQKEARITSDPLPVIQGAPVLFYQLFYNLINNSLKFSKKDVPPAITVSAIIVKEEGRDFAQITVADNGIGFKQEYATRIFNSFTRLNSKDSFEGTGLGLALCKKIAERHGGSITATGSPDEGARIIVTLPLLNNSI